MSGPNDSYDPKEVAALSDDALASAVDAGLAAINAAGDLDALAAVHAEHLGNRSAVALARRALGALPPPAKADAGRRVNEALGALTSAYAARLVVLERER